MIRWVLLSLILYAQELSSLYTSLRKAKGNQVYEILHAISQAWQEKNLDSALFWADRLLGFSQKNKNFYWMGRARLLRAELYRDSVLSYQELLSVHRLLPQAPALYPLLSYQWGNFYFRYGAWREAAQYYFTAWQEMPTPDSSLLIRMVEACLLSDELHIARKALARAPNAPYVAALKALVDVQEKNCTDVPSPHGALPTDSNLLAAWWYAWARCALEKHDTLAALSALDTTLQYNSDPYYGITALLWALEARNEHFFYKWLPLTEKYTDTLARWEVWILVGDKAAQEKNYLKAIQSYYAASSVCAPNLNAILVRIDLLANHMPDVWLEKFYKKLSSCYVDSWKLKFHYLFWLSEAKAFSKALRISTELTTAPFPDSVRLPLFLEHAYLQAKNAQYGAAIALLDSLLQRSLPSYEKADIALLAAQISFERGDPAGSMFYLEHARRLFANLDTSYAQKIQTILQMWQKNYVLASKELSQMAKNYRRFRFTPPLQKPIPSIYTGNLKGRRGILWLPR